MSSMYRPALRLFRPIVSDESRLIATYAITAEPANIEARAAALAVEQSVEMPPSAITDPYVQTAILAQVRSIAPMARHLYRVELGIAAATTGHEAGQLLNMLFGNSSIHRDLSLIDLAVPSGFAASFGGPRQGLTGLRARADAGRRPLTCSALKPQGLPPDALARLAAQFAEGGIDFIKDDHGIADQAYSPFAERVPAIADAIANVAARTGAATCYLPSLSGDLDALRRQIAILRACGLDGALVAPMIVGLPSFHRLVREAPDIAFMAHPALAGSSAPGAGGIAPPVLLGTIFRLLGADASVFPNHGGRFGYSPATCLGLAEAALRPWDGLRPTCPVPAGGMSTERVGEMLDFYGPDVMLLIGGALLAAGAELPRATERFVTATRNHCFGTNG